MRRLHYQGGKTDGFHYRYEYDADNRLKNAFLSLDGMIYDRDAEYFYYLHGPLARVQLGQLKVQGLDYAYTIHGWTKGLNSAALMPEADMGRDGFMDETPGVPPHYSDLPDQHGLFGRDAAGFVLDYYDGDFKPTVDWVMNSTDNSYSFLPNWGTGGGTGLDNASEGLFDGNIRAMTSAIDTRFMTGSVPRTAGRAFKYDQLGRVVTCDFFTDLSANVWGVDTRFPVGVYQSSGNVNLTTLAQPHQTAYKYDFNGNIEKVWRANAAGGLFDRLSYHYVSNTNRLNFVEDSITAPTSPEVNNDLENQTANNYAYDAAGQLTEDEQEEIESIEWTHEGKVKRVNRTSESAKAGLEFLYDASGSRICKIVKPAGADASRWLRTWYVRDADGNILTTYRTGIEAGEPTEECGEINYAEAETLKLVQDEVHLYGSSRLGVWRMKRELGWWHRTYGCVEGEVVMTAEVPALASPEPAASDVFTFDRGEKRYEISNHLGNVLAVVGDRKIVVTSSSNDWLFDHYLADLWSVSDYHPFGMAVEERSWAAEEYRFGFNGKENDAEWDAQDYGMRTYIPKLCRFVSADPLIVYDQQYAWYSGYQFAGNKPIRCIDLDGLEEWETMDNQSVFGPYSTQYANSQGWSSVGEVELDPVLIEADRPNKGWQDWSFADKERQLVDYFESNLEQLFMSERGIEIVEKLTNDFHELAKLIIINNRIMGPINEVHKEIYDGENIFRERHEDGFPEPIVPLPNLGKGPRLHRNSKALIEDTYVYRIIDNKTGEIYKYGIGSGKLTRKGTLPRLTSQVNDLNKSNPGASYSGTIISKYSDRASAISEETRLIREYKKENNNRRPIGNKED